jgi:hypothetical protein
MGVLKISLFYALSLAVVPVSCSLSLDPGSYWSGVCPSGQKACSEVCVDVNDVTHGCGNPNSCESCDLLGANAKCVAGACVIDSCMSGSLDCNSDTTDGCEIDSTTDPLNCGYCGHVCTVMSQTATATCQASLCSAICRQGYADCNDQPHACETHVEADDSNCGSCGNLCPNKTKCIASKCKAITASP